VKKRKLLLDSCIAGAVARQLRADGHDVVTVADRGADPGDAAILELAISEGRVLVTIDTDFGMLVFRDGAKHVGVLRLRDNTPNALATRASEIVRSHGDDLEAGLFVTDDEDRVRVTKR
jgi:predicted nuclease of predicted toxin-antitoxin system